MHQSSMGRAKVDVVAGSEYRFQSNNRHRYPPCYDGADYGLLGYFFTAAGKPSRELAPRSLRSRMSGKVLKGQMGESILHKMERGGNRELSICTARSNIKSAFT
jgi:hypothetical protein